MKARYFSYEIKITRSFVYTIVLSPGASMTFPENIQEFDSFSIGQRIQDIWLQKGIKALDMAVQVDLSKDQYSRIERGTSICKITTLHKIAQYLEVSADYLLYGTKDELYIDQIRIFLRGMKKREKEKLIKILEIISS